MTANIDNLHDGKSVARIREKGLVGGYKLITTGKGLVGGYKLITTEKAVIERVDARFDSSPRGSVVYCIVWINGNDKWGRGVGKAGGYGYDKKSAALGAALRDAGVVLNKNIEGVGESAELEAIRALGDALGFPDAILVDFHP